MSDAAQPPTPDHLRELLADDALEVAATCLDRLAAGDVGSRKGAIRVLHDFVERRPDVFEQLAVPVSAFLTDEDRAVRLTTAKLFVALARAEPTLVRPCVEPLAARLADDAEFYYVRARCAESLGYLALDAPGAVGDPEILADLRVGLSFDEPEVREKLAKALAYVALGDPSRLRHQVSSLAGHLDDDRDLVRYHLCTTLAVVGCEYPDRLVDAVDALRARATDADPYVRGRALEALGLLAAAEATDESVIPSDDLPPPGESDDDTPAFLADRLQFLQSQSSADGPAVVPEAVGTVTSIREGTADVVEAMTSPDGDGCPHCGAALPADGPPMCPRCGAPR
jgi:HEAT repeat protein